MTVSRREAARWRGARAALAFAAAFLLAVSPVAASSFELVGAAHVDGAVRLKGELEGSLESAGVQAFWHNPEDAARLAFSLTDGHVMVVDFPVYRVAEGEFTDWHGDVPLEPQVLEEYTVSGTVSEVESAPTSFRLILPHDTDGNLSIPLDGRQQIRLGVPGETGRTATQRPMLGPVDGVPRAWDLPAAGARASFSPHAQVNLTGDVAALALGGTFDIVGDDGSRERVVTGEFWDDSHVASPDGEARTGIVHQIALVIVAADARTTIDVGDWSALRVVTRSITGNLRGDIELGNTAVDFRVGGEQIDGTYALVHAIGSFALTGSSGSSEREWQLDGDATFVGLDGQDFLGSRGAHLLQAAIAAGVSLALLWTVLSKAGKELLAFVGLRNLADPLASDNRLDILRLITNNPGITVSMLCKESGLARASVRHHIGILSRADLVSRHQPGKVAHWTLNSGSLDVPGPDAGLGRTGPATLREAFAASGHPKRQLILETIADIGEGHYGDLKAHWSAQGTKPLRQDEVSYHGKRLEEAGLVTRTRRQGRIVWRVRVATDETITLQLANFLRGQPAAEELARLAHAADPRDRSVPRHQLPSSRRERRHIRLLEGVGLLQRDPATQDVVLADQADLVAQSL